MRLTSATLEQWHSPGGQVCAVGHDKVIKVKGPIWFSCFAQGRGQCWAKATYSKGSSDLLIALPLTLMLSSYNISACVCAPREPLDA